MIKDDNDSLENAEKNSPLKRKTLADFDDSPYFGNLNSDKVKDFINYSVERYQKLPHHRSGYPEAGMEAAIFGVTVLIVALACGIASRKGHSLQDDMINRFKEQINDKITEFHNKRLRWRQDELEKQRHEQDWETFNDQVIEDFLQFFNDISNDNTEEYKLDKKFFKNKGTSIYKKNVGTEDLEVNKELYERIVNYNWNEKVGLNTDIINDREAKLTSLPVLKSLLTAVNDETIEKLGKVFEFIDVYLSQKSPDQLEEMKREGNRPENILRESNLQFSLGSKEKKEVKFHRGGSGSFSQNTYVWNKHVVLKNNDNEKLPDIPEQSIIQKTPSIAKIEDHIVLAQQSSSLANSRYGSFSQTTSSSGSNASVPTTQNHENKPTSR